MPDKALPENIQYLIYGVLLFQLAGTFISFFVRDYFKRQQRDIDRIKDFIENCPIDSVAEQSKSNREDIKELREEIRAISRSFGK